MLTTEQRAQRREDMDALIASMKRVSDALDALVEAVPGGLTRDELECVAERFARLVRESGPRRGLCRFERPAVNA